MSKVVKPFQFEPELVEIDGNEEITRGDEVEEDQEERVDG